MKKYIFCLLLFVPFIVHAQNMPTGLNILTDKTWADPDIDWRAHGTCFYNYDGEIYVAAYTVKKVQTFPSLYTAYPYFYKCYASTSSAALSPLNFANKNYIDYYGYLGEDGCDHEAKIMGHNFFFEFNEQLWYYQHVHANYYNKGLCDESYACFARMPQKSTDKWYTFTTHYEPAMDYYPMAGVQLDSTLIFFCQDEESSSAYYKQWYLQSYQFSNNKFVYLGWSRISNIPGDRFGGIIARQGNSGPMLILNTYNSSTHETYLGMLLPTDSWNGVMIFSYIPYTGVPVLADPGASTIVSGSIRGARSSSYVDPYPQMSERMSLITVSSATSSGNYYLSYLEYLIGNDWLDPITFGTVAVPSSYYPHKDDDEFNLEPCYGMILGDYNDSIPGMDGYQKYNWVFFPNSSGNIAGVGFQSDVWMANPNSLVTSNDLTDTVTYGQDIRSLWTLVGIVEGAPPSVIDWEVWDSNYPTQYRPTELTLEQISTSDTNTTASCKYGSSFTQGTEISTGSEKLEVGFGSKTKYSKCLQEKVSMTTTTEQVISLGFELNEHSQHYGAFIYMVPEIYRFSYQVFPWYDYQHQYPVYNSLQYMFQVYGSALRIVKVYYDEWPFNIADPTADLLKYWTADYRPGFAHAVYGLSPKNVSWSDGFMGTRNFLRKGSDSTSTFQCDYGYEKEYSAGVSIPKVFSENISYGQQIEYASDVEVRTGFGNSIEISLMNMVEKEKGIDMTYVSIDTYLLKPENNSTGYLYDSLDGQKPWYIGYIVGNCENELRLLSPLGGACLEPQDLVFTWTTENGPLRNFTLFINNEPFTSPTSTLFSAGTGDRTAVSLKDFIPEKGRTYYWQVRGDGPGGQAIWSEARAFTIGCDEDRPAEAPGINAVVYPNPAIGSDIRITIVPEEEGEISVSLVSVNGVVISSREVSNEDSRPVDLSFSGLALPTGVYFAVIRSHDSQVVKKVVVR